MWRGPYALVLEGSHRRRGTEPPVRWSVVPRKGDEVVRESVESTSFFICRSTEQGTTCDGGGR